MISLRAYRFTREAILLNSRDHNRFFGHIKKLISPFNNSMKLRINDIETDDPVFVSDALNKSVASNFSCNIHTSPDHCQSNSFIYRVSFVSCRRPSSSHAY